MIVSINENIFKTLDAEKITALKFLLYLISYKNRYQLKTSMAIPENIEKSFNTYENEILRQAYIGSINDNGYDCEISTEGFLYDEERIFTLDEGIRFLQEQFLIILENNQNDSKFILAILEIFGQNVLQKALLENWVIFSNAGGCSNVRNFIEAQIASYRGKIKFLKCYVILDSDKYAPNHVNKQAQANFEYLREKKIPFHVWEKRMMENYLPDEAFPDSVWKSAFVTMSNIQKDYYRIHGGFKQDQKYMKDSAAATHPDKSMLILEQQQLYNDVSTTNYQYLFKGMLMSNFKDEYPKLFENRDNVNYDTLTHKTLHQSNPNELKCVLNEIATFI